MSGLVRMSGPNHPRHMEEQPTQRPISAGKCWRRFRAGDPAGTPLAEWAYVTPRFSEGIRQRALQSATPEIQFETAFVWFNLNFEPYGAWPYALPPSIGASATGLHQAAYAPDSLDSAAALSGEFGDILPGAVVVEVANNLPGRWKLRQRPAPLSADPTELPTDRVELGALILARLTATEDILRDLSPSPGEIGHNGPPEGFQLTPDDERETQAAISQARAAEVAEGKASGTELQAAADAFKPLGVKIRERVLGMLATLGPAFAAGMAHEAGKTFAKWLLADEHIHELIALLEHAARLAGHH